jgi:hypothetical protein
VRNRRTVLFDARVFQDAPIFFVITGLVPVIPTIGAQRSSNRDGRDRPGHDGGEAMNLLWPYCQGPKDCISESRFVFCTIR